MEDKKDSKARKGDWKERLKEEMQRNAKEVVYTITCVVGEQPAHMQRLPSWLVFSIVK